MTEKTRLIIAESTKDFVEKELDENLEELSEEEIISRLKQSKFVTTKVESTGEIKIRRVLNG
jgi:hypothetical protein|nr:MAG TPA: hypothetical protein [Caudoviricetes sp.]